MPPLLQLILKYCGEENLKIKVGKLKTAVIYFYIAHYNEFIWYVVEVSIYSDGIYSKHVPKILSGTKGIFVLPHTHHSHVFRGSKPSKPP